MSKLEELRAKLRNMDRRTSNTGSDKTIYPFWNMKAGNNSHIRFLPDKDPDNTFFWVEKQMINLTFPGIKGQDETKEITVKVPCMEMFGETCPVTDEIRPWWNEPSLEASASKYWKKRTYIFQGFIVADGLNETEAPENPIRRFAINNKLFKTIRAALLDEEMISMPCDYDNGTNFIINKEQDGKWPSYDTSKYARKESPLSQEQLDAITEHGLNNLSDSLPKKPTPEALAAIYEMFEASLEGDLYDPSKWAKYYRPYGLEYEESATAKPAPAPAPATPAPATTASAEDASGSLPFEPDNVETNDSGDQSADDIIAMIRNRKG